MAPDQFDEAVYDKFEVNKTTNTVHEYSLRALPLIHISLQENGGSTARGDSSEDLPRYADQYAFRQRDGQSCKAISTQSVSQGLPCTVLFSYINTRPHSGDHHCARNVIWRLTGARHCMIALMTLLNSTFVTTACQAHRSVREYRPPHPFTTSSTCECFHLFYYKPSAGTFLSTCLVLAPICKQTCLAIPFSCYLSTCVTTYSSACPASA